MTSKELLLTLAAIGIGFLGLGYQKHNMMQILLSQNKWK